MNGNEDVLVVGGGYAGVMAANRLQQRESVTVTVVNPRRVFVPRLRLHQLVGGTHAATVDYREVLADRARLLVDSVTAIDAAERSVTLADGRRLRYDYLVYAAGSGDPGLRVEGAAEFAYPMASLETARRLRSTLDATPVAAPVTVVGGGPTGVEVATELAEWGRAVTLVSGDRVAPYLHERARRTARRYLDRLGVRLIEGADAAVAAVTREAVELRDGRSLPSRVTIWAAGFGVPDLASRSGLSTDAAGRLLTDETLTSVDDDRIVAAGDSAAPSQLPFRMSAYAAGCLGAHAADTVLHRLAGEPPTAIDLAFPAMCISFGRGAGIFQLAHKDDTAMRLFFPGFAGRKLKELSCQASVKHLTTEANKPGAHHWPKDGRHRPEQLRTRRDGARTP